MELGRIAPPPHTHTLTSFQFDFVQATSRHNLLSSYSICQQIFGVPTQLLVVDPSNQMDRLCRSNHGHYAVVVDSFSRRFGNPFDVRTNFCCILTMAIPTVLFELCYEYQKGIDVRQVVFLVNFRCFLLKK